MTTYTVTGYDRRDLSAFSTTIAADSEGFAWHAVVSTMPNVVVTDVKAA